jgi:hypothetical protein
VDVREFVMNWSINDYVMLTGFFLMVVVLGIITAPSLPAAMEFEVNNQRHIAHKAVYAQYQEFTKNNKGN